MSVDLLAVALGHHTTRHSTIALGVARSQIIGGHLLGEKSLRHGWWERKWVPLPRVFRLQNPKDPEAEWEFRDGDFFSKPSYSPAARSTRLVRAGKLKSSRRSFGWRRMATDGSRWWDSDFPERSERARMVRKHLADAVQGIRDATGYDVITEAEVDDCASVLCPASWHGLLLCKRVVEIAAVPPREAELPIWEAAE